MFSSLVGSGSSLARRISETHLDFAVAMKMVNTASEREGGDWEGGDWEGGRGGSLNRC